MGSVPDANIIGRAIKKTSRNIAIKKIGNDIRKWMMPSKMKNNAECGKLYMMRIIKN